MLEQYILAHDLGTSAIKSTLVDCGGRIVQSCSEGYPTAQRFPGWAEQDPLDWWCAFCQNCRTLTAGRNPRSIVGISLTGQMMCCLPVGKSGEILHPAILWSDRRAEKEWEALARDFGQETLYQITGMRGSANYSLPKIAWFRRHFPREYELTSSFLSPKDYINYRLTGISATDPENAAYMYCYDRRAKAWSDPLLRACGVDAGKMPQVIPTGKVLGEITPDAGEACGLAAGTPVIMGIGDGGAATLGAGVIAPGEAYTSLGTSSWVCAVTDPAFGTLSPKDGISQLDYFGMQRVSGTMQAGGYAFSWLRDTFFREGSVPAGEDPLVQMNRLAEQASPGSNGLLFHPFLFGERAPVWDSRLRSAFLGITARTTQAEFCRSVQEGVSMHLNWIFRRICAGQHGAVQSMKLIGGGAHSRLWQQIFADVYGIPVCTVQQPGQAAALGLSVMTGITLGLYPDVSVIREFQTIRDVVEPDESRSALYRELQEIYQDSAAALTELNHRLARFQERANTPDTH